MSFQRIGLEWLLARVPPYSDRGPNRRFNAVWLPSEAKWRSLKTYSYFN